jgi:signal transduction histidine kinase/PAS domain-containing protein
MASYKYRKIGLALLEELVSLLLKGESVVLLAPRFGGKRHTIRRLEAILRGRYGGPVAAPNITAECKSIPDLASAIALSLSAYLRSEAPILAWQSIFEPLDGCWKALQQPIVLLVPNLDCLPHVLAGQFLEGVQSQVEAGHLVVVLGSNRNIAGLFHGPKSESSFTHYFVLQGCDLQEFGGLCRDYIQGLGLEVSPGFVEELCQNTGGNPYLMRLIFYRAVEAAVQDRKIPRAPLSSSDAKCRLRLDPGAAFSGSLVLRHACMRIEHAPECWSELERLRQGEEIPVSLAESGPGALEMSGFAIRQGEKLRLSSPVIADFVNDYFTPRRFADLYATAHQWKEAVARYEGLAPAEWRRPESLEDRYDLAGPSHALQTKMEDAAHGEDGPARVEALLAEGALYLLGFSELTFWTYERGWILDKTVFGALADDQQYGLSQVFPAQLPNEAGWILLPDPWSRCAISARMKTFGETHPRLLVLSDFAPAIPISAERRTASRELVDAFLRAHAQASEIRSLNGQLLLRQRHFDILDAILDSIGTDIRDVEHVFRRAAQELRKLNYKRVFFCGVDPERKRIRGVWDESSCKDVIDVAAETDYALSEPTQDIQPYVVHTRVSKVVEDATREPLAAPKVVKLADVKAFAVVPILDRDGQVLGTIHIERADGRVPSKQEVENLELFGRHLAAVFSLGEQVTMLEKAVDAIPDPIAIVDPNSNVRYANLPAAKLLNVVAGWRNRSGAKPLTGANSVSLSPLLASSVDAQAHAQELTGLNGCPAGNRFQAVAEPILNLHQQTIGALLHMRDITGLDRLVSVIHGVMHASADNAIAAVLDAIVQLGYPSPRLYQFIDGQLVSKQALDLEPQLAEQFNAGQIPLAPHIKGHVSWRCLEQKEAALFCYDPSRRGGSIISTRKGLSAIVAPEEQILPLLGKRPGAYWVDLPLLCDQSWLGKITVLCTPAIEPSDFWLLKVFAALVSAILHSRQELEAEADRRRRWMKEGYERSLAFVSHNLKSRLYGLTVLSERYQRRDSTGEDLVTLNQDFTRILAGIQDFISRVHDVFSVPPPRRTRFDLKEMLNNILQTQVPNGVERELRCSHESIDYQGDPELLQSAVIEMVCNSVRALRNVSHPRLVVDLRRTPDPDLPIQLSVQDNGIGVPQDVKSRAFEEFVSQWPGQERGTGLGLSFVSRVVERHGGKVSIEDAPEGGAVVVIRLPNGTEVNHD